MHCKVVVKLNVLIVDTHLTVSLLIGHWTCNSQFAASGHHHIVALDKLFTPGCLCHQAV